MAFVIEVKGKELQIKFDYRTVFKANNQLGSVDEKGNRNADGASNLFNRILEQDDTAIFDLIQLAHTGKLTENEIFEAIEKHLEKAGDDESEAYDALFTEIKEEMLRSGFFVKKLEKQIENMEKGKEIIEAREDEQSKMQAKAVGELIQRLKQELS